MSKKQLVLVGTYTQPIKFGTGQILEGKGKGIYSYYLNMETGVLEDEKLSPGIVNPSYLTMNKAANRVYAVNELKEYEGKAQGSASSFSFDLKTREMKLLNTRGTGGTDPCHIVLNDKDSHVYISNFMSGSVCVFPIAKDGSLAESNQFIQHEGSSVNKARQAGPHAHSLIFDNPGNYAFVPDLGIDRLMAYAADPITGVLTPAKAPYYQAKPGEGPRHCVFDRNGRFVYLINELACSVSALEYNDRDASFTHLQTIDTTTKDNPVHNSCADIQMLPNGKFLYGSNRGHNTIVIYAINQTTGQLSLVGHESSGGEIPRSFHIDPTGSFLLAANQDTDNIVVFRIDNATGKLTKVSEHKAYTPVCVKSYEI